MRYCYYVNRATPSHFLFSIIIITRIIIFMEMEIALHLNGTKNRQSLFSSYASTYKRDPSNI